MSRAGDRLFLEQGYVPPDEGWPEHEGDGAALLDEVEAFLRRFVAFPTEHAAVAVTLWAGHTHLADQFDSTPRLALLSPEKQSGKTRTLELLELVCSGAEFLSDASASFVFRRIGAGAVTVLLDECDAIWRAKNADETHEALRSIVNAGHRKRATVGRVEMNGKTAELARFPVFAPVALAGIGDCLPDTVLDRAVIVRMRRRAPGEHVEAYRERSAGAEGEDLAGRLADWCAGVAGKVGHPWPDMPAGVADRAADVWEPLLAVADLAGGTWPGRAREACAAFVNGSGDETASEGVRLLADLHQVFGDADALATQTILDRLHTLDESPWADIYGKPLDPRGLATRLKPYGIRSRVVRIGDHTPRGYRRADLHDAWNRYLPHPPATDATSATSLASTVADVADVARGAGRDSAGPVCAVCGEAMTPVEHGQTAHPACADTEPRRRRIRDAPADAVRVDRRTRWGNPYRVEDHGRGEAVRLHREQLAAGTLPAVNGYEPATVADVRAELAGRDLACHCQPDEACHADTLLSIANQNGDQP